MDKKVQAWAKKAAAKGTGWPKEKLKAAKKLGKKLERAEGIDNPCALARWMVARGAKAR